MIDVQFPEKRKISDMTEEEEMEICDLVGVFFADNIKNALLNKTKYNLDIHTAIILIDYLRCRNFQI